MNKCTHLSLAIVFICMTGISSTVQAQATYKAKDTKEIDMKLLGTSTMHDWEMGTRKVDGEAQFGFKPGNESELIAVKSLTFSLHVIDLKSENKALDKNANKALKSDEFKDIRYSMTSAVVSPEKGDKFLIKSQGKLTIAGVTKDISMDVHCVINKDATVNCSGTYQLKMTDYNVKPPTFMLGAMKTGDSITLEFVVIYEKDRHLSEYIF